MKSIYLSRHAKSSWGDLALKDIDRPLNTRGKRDAPLMSAQLKRKIGSIDLCVCSPSKRTRSTAKHFKRVFDFAEYEVADRIYHGSIEDMLSVINGLNDDYSSAILFGHNPTFTYLYNLFSQDPIDNLPTSGLFGLKSTAKSWGDIDTTNTEVEFLIYPKMYL